MWLFCLTVVWSDCVLEWFFCLTVFWCHFLSNLVLVRLLGLTVLLWNCFTQLCYCAIVWSEIGIVLLVDVLCPAVIGWSICDLVWPVCPPFSEITRWYCALVFKLCFGLTVLSIFTDMTGWSNYVCVWLVGLIVCCYYWLAYLWSDVTGWPDCFYTTDLTVFFCDWLACDFVWLVDLIISVVTDWPYCYQVWLDGLTMF